MAIVKFTRHLKRFFPGIEPMTVDVGTVAEVVDAVNAVHDGFERYVVDDQKRLRKHVNIFVGNTMITDRVTLTDVVGPDDEVFIMQALSGG